MGIYKIILINIFEYDFHFTLALTSKEALSYIYISIIQVHGINVQDRSNIYNNNNHIQKNHMINSLVESMVVYKRCSAPAHWRNLNIARHMSCSCKNRSAGSILCRNYPHIYLCHLYRIKPKQRYQNH